MSSLYAGLYANRSRLIGKEAFFKIWGTHSSNCSFTFVVVVKKGAFIPLAIIFWPCADRDLILEHAYEYTVLV